MLCFWKLLLPNLRRRQASRPRGIAALALPTPTPNPRRRLAHVMALLSPELPYQHACRHVHTHTHSGRRISSTRGGEGG